MGAGWGIRGSFGHCRGAMMPGAMLGLVLAVCAGRKDWWRRSPLIGLLAGIGWAFGGSSSYGLLVGYTLKESLSTSVYGYFALMIVGALYSSIGCGLYGLALTQRRSFLENSLWPLAITYLVWLALDWAGVTAWGLSLVQKDPNFPEATHWLFDTVWVYALASLPVSCLLMLVKKWREPAILMLLMTLGWWLVSFAITGAIGFRINPSRNDSWAGVAGILLGLVAYLSWKQNRATLQLVCYGLIAGGVGFPIGQFLQAMGRLKFGPMASVPFLSELNHWTLMEQTFGYCMGLGAALGTLKLIRRGLAPPEEDCGNCKLNWVSAWILLGVLLVFNAGTNYRRWQELELAKPTVMNVSTSVILFWVAILWLAILGWTLYAQRKKLVDLLPSTPKGKAQMLALLMMMAVMSLYFMLPSLGLPTSLMFVGAFSVTGLCVMHSGSLSSSLADSIDPQHAATKTPNPVRENADTWRLGWGWVVTGVLVILLQCLLGYATTYLIR